MEIHRNILTANKKQKKSLITTSTWHESISEKKVCSAKVMKAAHLRRLLLRDAARAQITTTKTSRWRCWRRRLELCLLSLVCQARLWRVDGPMTRHPDIKEKRWRAFYPIDLRSSRQNSRLSRTMWFFFSFILVSFVFPSFLFLFVIHKTMPVTATIH